MRVSELQNLLRDLELRPDRKLGQNFLIDDNVARWIVEQLRIAPSDVVIEVGPGAGALTKHLVGRCRRLILIEKDPKLADHIENHYRRHGWHFEVVRGDAVEHDIRPLFREGRVKLIGNLPYSAGTEIMRTFLTPPTPVAEAVVMVQREVADRICAGPRSKDYGVLSLMLQEVWHPQLLKTVKPPIFYPQPEVDSAVVHFAPRAADDFPPHSPQTFEEIVKKGFSRRRKQLHNNLEIHADKWASIAKKANLAPTARAEELSLQRWINLSNILEKHPCRKQTGNGDEIFDVVDKRDNVTGRATRADVHERKLLHRAVHVFLFNKEGELYLQKRSHLKDSHPGRWDSSASGHLDTGERYADAAHRELKEELMVRPRKPLERLGKIAAGPGTDWEFIELYRCEYGGKVRTHGNEVATGGFFPLEEIADWVDDRPQDFATGFVTCFRWFVVNVLAKGSA
ncbi:MAG: ribosomal RNA small subunit methyltransferase A [Verrucomicrobiae bacterium]|nr:ribosomal RNA small subunit methyltransferase A [Verrucomicrobiae bacterium]MCP5539714.1 ribosomal RNA small subunit methyltransferase A [Akkermansiaceae bacterium]MCP5549451.1 ribosomal RNA small subunit methyltransferase A [Akkermansiaceae bacterium]